MGQFYYADVLIAPVYSEKSNTLMMEGNQYVFHVSARATKVDIKRAIKERFNVEVASVNIVNLPRKPKRAGRYMYKTNKRRKAVVTLAEGQTIPELREAM